MGQKVNPIGLRLGIIRQAESRWYADDKFSDWLVQDINLRQYLKTRLKAAAVSRVVIERPANKVRITVYSGRPGVIIGKKGADIEVLRADLSKRLGTEVAVNLVEIRKPEADAQLVAEGVAQQLERRISFRRAMKRAVQGAMRLGVGGIRINVSGRLSGADIARMEWYREGRVPLHTLRAYIDYAESSAMTTYGVIGVKVWIFKGEILEHNPQARDQREAEGLVNTPVTRPQAANSSAPAAAPASA